MKKTKNKTILIILFSLLFMLSVITSIDSYNKCNFTGIVTHKEIEEIHGSWIVWKNYIIQVDTWFGNKRYLIEDSNIYETIEIGKEYSFKKNSPFTTYIKIRIMFSYFFLINTYI